MGAFFFYLIFVISFNDKITALMKKFFLFRREQITIFSSTSSNDGQGLSVIAIPANKLSFITATLGKVHFNFDDASVYDYVTLPSSDVIDKTHITVSCQDGKEVSLMESVMNFLAADDKRNILRFDSVDQSATLKEAKVDGFEDVAAIVNDTPINIVTQQPDPSTAIIAGVDFLSDINKPDIDYNHTGITQSDGQHISAWANDTNALLGTDYDTTDEGSSNTLAKAAGTTSYSKEKSAHMQAGNYFQLANAYEATAEYTMYCAFGFPAYTNMHEIFGSANNTCKGFSNGKQDIFSMIHQNIVGLPATQTTNNEDNLTKKYRFPDLGLETNATDHQSMYVFVIRRDKEYNLYLYNFRGDVVAIIPSKVSGTGGRTDGTLNIKTFGGVGPDYSFKAYLSRFGVVGRDIGHNVARSIAKDLYKTYAYNYATFN